MLLVLHVNFEEVDKVVLLLLFIVWPSEVSKDVPEHAREVADAHYNEQ